MRLSLTRKFWLNKRKPLYGQALKTMVLYMIGMVHGA